MERRALPGAAKGGLFKALILVGAAVDVQGPENTGFR
jgi:hypothetical protein